MFLGGAIGIIPIALLRRHIPESPRWLIGKFRFEEANKLIEYIEACCTGSVSIDMQTLLNKETTTY